ncbi:MAG TPA: hypothetical protein VER08_00160, partial [Pyrinomonadaceae bacterium]|nr:hypothetical protein [Pyrinomonadaceae bacterium]
PARPQAPPATYAPAAPPRHEAHAAPGLPPTAQAHAPAAKSGALPPWLARYALVLAVPCVVLLAASLLLYVFTRNRDSRNVGAGGDAPEVSRDNSSEREPEPERDGRHETAPPADDSKGVGRANDAADSPGDARSADAASTGGSSSPGGASSPSGGAVSDEQLAQAVRRVMSSMSTADNAPYLPESGVRDVAAKVRSYGASPSALAERLRAARRACADVNAQAQRINLRPPLLMYAALAESEGGADPAAAARQMSQKLLTLRATFGTDTANSALLLLAAYPYPFNPPIGTQQRTVHPLYAELIRTGGQRSRVDPAVARTVWFLREQGSLRADAYELVVRTLAIGVIAQNPQRYGVNADPLLC